MSGGKLNAELDKKKTSSEKQHHRNKKDNLHIQNLYLYIIMEYNHQISFLFMNTLFKINYKSNCFINISHLYIKYKITPWILNILLLLDMFFSCFSCHSFDATNMELIGWCIVNNSKHCLFLKKNKFTFKCNFWHIYTVLSNNHTLLRSNYPESP